MEYIKPEIGDIYKDYQIDYHVLILDHIKLDLYLCLHLETSKVKEYGFVKECWGWIKVA